MDREQFKQLIIKYSQEIGIDKIGFTTGDPFLVLKDQLKEQQLLNYQSGFEEADIELRTVPAKTMPEVKTIIAIALAYPSRWENPPVSIPGSYRGVFCRASWGEDYHHVLRRKLNLLGSFITAHVPTAKIEVMVDTGVLSDRAVAVRAGLGFSGKNTSLITPEFGSYVYLGELLTDIYIPPDQPLLEDCGDCNICQTACPTGAIVQPGQLDSKACLAYQSQTKEMLPERFRHKLGNRLYGCDTCQVVCPKNKVNFTHQPEFTPALEDVKPLLKPLLKLTNREFKQRFGQMAGSWRGKTPIQRNAIISLVHFKDKTALPQLKEIVKSNHNPVLRATAAWAIGMLGSGPEQAFLKLCLDTETEQLVIDQLDKAILNLDGVLQ